MCARLCACMHLHDVVATISENAFTSGLVSCSLMFFYYAIVCCLCEGCVRVYVCACVCVCLCGCVCAVSVRGCVHVCGGVHTRKCFLHLLVRCAVFSCALSACVCG